VYLLSLAQAAAADFLLADFQQGQRSLLVDF